MNTNNKLRVIYNAQETCDSYKSDSLNDIDGISPADWLVAVVGTLQRRKAQDDAIRAVRMAERVIPNIKLLLIGDGKKKYRDYLKNLSVEFNISNQIVFTGYRNDVSQILSRCKLLLMPSWDEPCGRVIIEAMAAGIPVIGTDSGGTKEIIQEGVTGYLVPPKMPFEMAEKIIHLFKNPNVAKRLGVNGKKVAAEIFNVSNYVSGVEAVLGDVLAIFG